jgi:DNA (cytosine-5)-methyltransferase 1
MRVGDLFSGIGGFSLGLERAGMQTAWFAEVNPYASAVLRKHWPNVPNHGDVRGIGSGTVKPVDLLRDGA